MRVRVLLVSERKRASRGACWCGVVVVTQRVGVAVHETWSAGGKDFNILIAFTSKLIRDSTVKQGKKGDMKCV